MVKPRDRKESFLAIQRKRAFEESNCTVRSERTRGESSLQRGSSITGGLGGINCAEDTP